VAAPAHGPRVKRIRKVLVANRGEIARRVFRTCRELGIGTVAVFSEPDRKSAFALEADEAVALGGATPAESYLRGDAIVAAARRTGADAIHPGYGFLAESAAFARAVRDAGLVFVGPSPAAIAMMGNKLEAKLLMAQVGVPVLPSVAASGLSGSMLEEAVATLGWPVLVKAAAGGGGRGMRVVRSADDLEEALRGASREAEAAFGDGSLFLERYLEGARHVEVQVMGDAHGNVVSLLERECSIQRRHQKVLEEAPSPAVDEPLRQALGAAAVEAARAVGYVGAGTVEFLLTPQREFFFMEMNTRLQVEHPVTEAVIGLDLVRLQVHVAEGDVLPREAMTPTLSGHAIEVRLCAEDPARDFLPSTGTVHLFRVPAGPGLRVDSGIADGSAVSAHYDSLLAKLVAHAPTRAEAASRLAAAVSGTRLHGLVTNRDMLLALLRHPEFLEGRTDTQFLERHRPEVVGALAELPETERLHAAAAALGAAEDRRRRARVLSFLPSGWRNNPSGPQRAVFDGRRGRVEVAYRFARDRVLLHLEGDEPVLARAARLPDGSVDLEVGGVRRRYDVHAVDDVWYVDSPLGHSALREVSRFPEVAADATDNGSLRAPLPGRILRVAADPGSDVEEGALLVVLEAMKMEHQVTAPRRGRLSEVRVREGQQVDAGTVLAVLTDPA
jgi:propionyl-CoA carboxylase alpha chain